MTAELLTPARRGRTLPGTWWGIALIIAVPVVMLAAAAIVVLLLTVRPADAQDRIVLGQTAVPSRRARRGNSGKPVWCPKVPATTSTPTGAPASKVSLNAAEYNGVVGRCDRIVQLPRLRRGGEPSDIAYDSTIYPKVTEVAQHVYDAEGSLAPHYGWYGVGRALTLGNDATEAANRKVACPSGGTPTGRSCDESPHRSITRGCGVGRSVLGPLRTP